MQTISLEELLQKPKALSLEDLLKPRRPFTLGELKDKEKELLAEAQEKVKYQVEPSDKPSKWTSEFWSSLGETFRETPGGQLVTKEFWSEAGKNLVSDMAEMLQTERITPIGKQRALVEKGIQAYRALTGKEKPPTVGEEVGTQFRSGAEFVLFIPKTLFNLAKDPVNTIKENPLDVLFLVGAFAGTKAYKRAKAKIATKKWMTTGDLLNPLKDNPKIAPDLRQILQKIPADAEIDMPVASALEVIKTKAKGTAPIFKHWFDWIKEDIKKAGDLGLERKGVGRLIKYGKIGVRIPLRVFDYYKGLKRILYNEWRLADTSHLIEYDAVLKDIKGWNKKLSRKSRERVGVFADYQQEGGAELMKAMGKDMPELTPTEMQFYQWGQKVFHDLWPRINQVRTLAGADAMGKVPNYSTWIRNLHQLADLGIDITKEPAQVVEYHLSQTPFQFAKKRAKGVVKAGIELDYSKLLDIYNRKALEHIHLTPVIARARAVLEPFKVGDKTWSMYKEAPRLATWLEEWTDTIAGQKRGMPGGDWTVLTKFANKMRQNIAVAILSGNVRSALIQPTAFKLSYTLLGKKYFAIGLNLMLKKEWRDFAVKHSEHLKVRKWHQEAYIEGISDIGKKIQKTRVGEAVSTAKRAVGMAGLYPLQLLDFETARASWLGAYKMAREARGFGHKRAVVYADDLVVRTQASARPGDIAPIQRTPWGKLLTMFQTFVINEYDFLTHDVMGYKNPYMNMKTRSRHIARFVLASSIVNALYEGVLKVRSPYPAPEWAIIKGIREKDEWYQIAGQIGREAFETFPIFGGTFRWSTPYRVALPAFIQTGVIDPIQMVNRLLSKPTLTGDQLEWLGKVLGIAGTSQVRKYIRRRKKGMNHWEALIGVRAEDKGKKKKSTW